jgi:hypothetical protein
MVVPMMGFAFALMACGGLGSLIAMADPDRSNWRFVTLPVFLAGGCAILLSLMLSFLGAEILRSEILSGIGFFGGYFLGAVGGAILGIRSADKRGR